jgi:hypothetical protein
MDIWLPPKPAIIRPAPEVKKANFLPGWFPGAVAGLSGPTIEHIASTADSSNNVIYTFAGQSFGATSADRRIIVAVGGGHGSGNLSLSTVTIGGVSATIHVSTDNNGNTRNGHAAVASAPIPTGTSGDIVVEYATDALNMQECVISVYRATNLTSGTPFDTATSDNASALLIDIPANGFLIACAATVSGAGHTWPSPLVEDIDTGLDGVQLSNAHTPSNQVAETSFSAGPAGGGSGASRYAAATWA